MLQHRARKRDTQRVLDIEPLVSRHDNTSTKIPDKMSTGLRARPAPTEEEFLYRSDPMSSERRPPHENVTMPSDRIIQATINKAIDTLTNDPLNKLFPWAYSWSALAMSLAAHFE